MIELEQPHPVGHGRRATREELGVHVKRRSLEPEAVAAAAPRAPRAPAAVVRRVVAAPAVGAGALGVAVQVGIIKGIISNQ
jgi:hypothetical protein